MNSTRYWKRTPLEYYEDHDCLYKEKSKAQCISRSLGI